MTHNTQNMSARLHAVQAIYQMHQTGVKAKDIVPEFKEHRFGVEIDGESYVPPNEELFSKIVLGVEEHRSDLLSHLKEALKKEDKMRNVEDLLKAILLCGTFEILIHTEIDSPIVINDYIEITKAYYESTEKSLVNATLDSLQKKRLENQVS